MLSNIAVGAIVMVGVSEEVQSGQAGVVRGRPEGVRVESRRVAFLRSWGSCDGANGASEDYVRPAALRPMANLGGAHLGSSLSLLLSAFTSGLFVAPLPFAAFPASCDGR